MEEYTSPMSDLQSFVSIVATKIKKDQEEIRRSLGEGIALGDPAIYAQLVGRINGLESALLMLQSSIRDVLRGQDELELDDGSA